MKKISKAKYKQKFEARTKMMEKKAGIKENRLNKNKCHAVFVSSEYGPGKAPGAFLVLDRKKIE